MVLFGIKKVFKKDNLQLKSNKNHQKNISKIKNK
jgi:hypothetical protein